MGCWNEMRVFQCSLKPSLTLLYQNQRLDSTFAFIEGCLKTGRGKKKKKRLHSVSEFCPLKVVLKVMLDGLQKIN